MKVAMIGLRGLDDGLGGVEKVVRETSTRLVKRGVDVTCYCRPKYNQHDMFEGVKCINTATLNSKHAETAYYALGSLVKAAKGDYDVIHIHAMASAILAWIPRWIGRKKIVISVHGLDWQRAKWGAVARSILRFGEWSAVHQADYTTCVSLSLQTYFKMRYLHHPFAYIPNGCDLPPTDPVPVPEGLESKKYFLYMGRLVPEKGVHRLIKAYRQLDTAWPLIIAGPATHASKYKAQLDKLASGDSRIRFVGSVTGDTKEQLLSHAYMFVLPSELEGLPVALLEVASRGVCPVISCIPTSLEILGDQDLHMGFLFDPDSTEQLKTVLEVALDSPQIVHELGQRAKERVALNYSWDHVADQTLDVYRRVLGNADAS